MPDRSDFELVVITLQDEMVVHPRSPRETFTPGKKRPPRKSLGSVPSPEPGRPHGEAFQRIADEDCELHGFNRYDF